MTKKVWVVTFHFGRGQSQVIEFADKKQAQNAVNVGVFSNEDCINCSIYRKDVDEQSPLEKLNALMALRDKILSKM